MVRAIRYIVVAVLIAIYFIYGTPECYADGSLPFWERALTYSFFHASIWHLLVNCVAAWSLLVPRRKGLLKDMLLAYVIAVLVFPFSLRPVIGFSNLLYAICGLWTPPLDSPWWKKTEVVVFLVATIALLFVPHVSGLTHILAFLAGMAMAMMRRWANKNLKDAERFVK